MNTVQKTSTALSADPPPWKRFVLTILLLAALAAGGPPARAASPPADWLTPVPGFQIVKAFDKPEQNWNAGHRGIDVLALPGEPVRAPAKGSVRFAGDVAGKRVISLDIGEFTVSYEAVDALVKKGDEVFPGTHIGTVSDPSHCPQGCIHVGVWPRNSAKDYQNPAQFFSAEASVLLPEAQAPESLPPAPSGDDSSSGAGEWGGHQNGRIPAPALCSPETAPGHLLRCDAAKAFDRLSRAFKNDFGYLISVTDSYRSYEQQVILKKRKGRFAATPGTSNHGWGLAVDLGSSINVFGSAQHLWMRKRAPAFGWIHPQWARQGGSLPEAWHWEFKAG